ncbi:MAG: VPLPA-CTERM sorting domain-containing protein [Pseudomonadota bacterium]
MKKLLSAAACAATLALAGANAAELTFEGVIDEIQGSPELDFYSITVTNPGTYTFEVDGNGSGFMNSDLDTFVMVAVDDGDRSVDDIIDANDDGGPGFDSFLSLDLGVGTFLVAVSQCCISGDEFVSGVNSSTTLFPGNNVYRLRINGDFDTTPEVPIPAGALLFAGPAAFAALRRKKR